MNQIRLVILFAIISNVHLCFSQVWKTYVPYNKKGFWGYADTSGKLKIQPFTKLELGFFNANGIALTKDSSGNYGVINSLMKTVLTPKFKSIEVVNDQFLKVELRDYLYQLYHINGLKMLPFNFNTIVLDDKHPNDVFVFQKDDLLSVYKYDKKLKKLILKRQHKNAGKAYFVGDNHYSVTFHYTLETKTFNLLSGKEEEIPEGPMYDREFLNDNVIMTDFMEYKNQPVSYNFKEILSSEIRFEREEKCYYNRNLKYVKLNGKWGVISYDRKVIVPIVYDSLVSCAIYSDYNISDNSRTLAWIWILNNRYGIVCTDSTRNINFVYEDMYFFSSKYIMVKQNNKLGVLNYFGETVIPCEVDSFKFGFDNSLHWSTGNGILILYAIKGNKMALYDTKGTKSGYEIDEAKDIYDDKISPYGFTRSIKLRSGFLFGLAICDPDGIIYIPCQYKSLYYDGERIVLTNSEGDYTTYRFFKIKTVNNQSGYIDHLGRKYFEE